MPGPYPIVLIPAVRSPGLQGLPYDPLLNKFYTREQLNQMLADGLPGGSWISTDSWPTFAHYLVELKANGGDVLRLFQIGGRRSATRRDGQEEWVRLSAPDQENITPAQAVALASGKALPVSASSLLPTTVTPGGNPTYAPAPATTATAPASSNSNLITPAPTAAQAVQIAIAQDQAAQAAANGNLAPADTLFGFPKTLVYVGIGLAAFVMLKK